MSIIILGDQPAAYWQPVMETGGQKCRIEWIDKDTHHKWVVPTPTEAASFYFH